MGNTDDDEYDWNIKTFKSMYIHLPLIMYPRMVL